MYMKFSGAFNEFAPRQTPDNVNDLLQSLDVYLSVTLQVFGFKKIMFGSDWPVCNFGGPRGEQSWGLWREVVASWLERNRTSPDPEEWVWWRAGCEAYSVELA